MMRSEALKRVRILLAVLAWTGGAGSSPFLGHSHGSSAVPHEHASVGFVGHEHTASGLDDEHDYHHDDGLQLVESHFHLHTTWMGVPLSLPSHEGEGPDGESGSLRGRDALLGDGGVDAHSGPAVGSPLDAPACWPWQSLPLLPARSRTPTSPALDGLQAV